MQAPRSLLLVCDFNGHGGTQTQVMELLSGLDRSRFRPMLATLSLHPDLAVRVEALGVPVRNLGLRGAWRPGTWAAVAALSRFIRAEGVTLVHGFLLQGNLVAAAAARRAGVAYLTSVRNLELRKTPLQVAASRWAHGGAAAVTFNCIQVRDLVSRREGIPPGKARVIYNGLREAPGGISIESGSPWPPGAGPKLVCVASLFPKKGHPYLLDAFAEVAAAHERAALVLAGEGPCRPDIERRIAALGTPGRVIMAGYRCDARALIAQADLALLSSIEEGMPNVLLEAMAAGVPQVTTRAGGSAEAVEDGVTGYVVPPRDPVLMASRILRLLANPGLRASMAAASRARFERLFSAGRLARDHERLYESIPGGRA